MMMRGSWVMVLIAAACGGGSNGSGQLPDAPPAPDGNADSPVTVTVTVGGTPSPGVHVYFVAADGTPVKTVDTGADGTASAVIAAGGSVTVLDPFSLGEVRAVGQNALVTFMAVKPGDHLKIGNSDGASFAFALSVPSVTDATAYDVFTTCRFDAQPLPASSGPTASGTIELQGCHGAADIAIRARKENPQTHVSTPISGLFHAGVTIDGSAVNLTDSYAALTEFSATYTHAPAGGPARVTHAPLLPHGRLGTFEADLGGTGGTLAGAFQEPAVGAASSTVRATFELSSGEHEVIDWGALPVPYALDLSGVLVRAVAAPPRFDFASGAVVWSEATDGAVPDATITLIEAFRTAQSRNWNWFLLAPHTPEKLALPRLPTDVADWTPVAGDGASIDHVSLVKLAGGYDALRTHDIDFGDNSDLALISGATGRIALFNSVGSTHLQRSGGRAIASDRLAPRRPAGR
jgi:hypothetical protein